MPSQEDYLDQLLKGISEEPQMQEPPVDVPEFDMSLFEMSEAEMAGLEVAELELPEKEPTQSDMAETDSEEDILKKMVRENATIEDVLGDVEESEAIDELMSEDIMSVDEIEQILAENNSEAQMADLEMDPLNEEEDLMKLLEAASEVGGDLHDIHDMLQKADNNEAIDEDLLALLQADADVDEVARLQAELEGTDSTETESPTLSEKEQRAMEKKRLKEEKAAARRAEKEAKKAEKEAKRVAKKAVKETAKENAESAANSNEAAGADVFAGIDELSTADMLDLQDLLSVGDFASASEDVFSQLQQDVQSQTRPVITDVPKDSVTETVAGADDATVADMMEIDELLSLAGISALSETEVAAGDSSEVADVTDILLVDESEIGDLIPEKEKKGLFARIIDFLTETDEDDDEVRGTEDIPLSDENKNILEEMDKEEKGSGKKSKKAKKDKKSKKAEAELATLDDDEEAVEAKGKKAKKAKKSKKEKEQHLKVLPMEDSRSKLSKRAMLLVGVVCASVLAVIMLFVNLGGDFATRREAKKAYYKEDYETCYQVLYGKKLNESEQVMFAKSESILRINLRMREYEIFAEENSQVEALDVLIQTVYDYADLYAYAAKWNAGEEVSAVYAQMLGILQDKYNLTESDALEIAAEPDDVEYTKHVTAVAGGKKYVSTGTVSDKTVQTENLPDMLPEEKKFPENNGGQ